ncbi:MAG: 4Fe-4S binding protein [Nitrospirae bacterium]|nr:4Fe-4S binding protein [Nitrospirota bacterium]
MKPATYHARRWFFALLQAVLMLGLPFLRIHGESALRFDVPSLKLYFFGSVIWISEAYFFLLVLLLFFIGVMLFTVLYGRIWCGWACPQTVLSDFARSLERRAAWFTRNQVLRTTISHVSMLLLSLLVSADLIWFFVSPYDMFAEIKNRTLGPWVFWSWTLFTVLIYLNLAFIRQRFCRSVCPYSRLQSAFFDDRTLTIAFNRKREEECLGCEACVRTCPSGIDIRDGLQVECINCAECIDACAGQIAEQGKEPLIEYSRGDSSDGAQKGPRARAIGLSLVFAFIAAMLAYQIYARMPVDFWVFRDEVQSYQQAGTKGGMLNAYLLTVENRSLVPAGYRLSISGIKDAELMVPRNPILLHPNSSLRIKVYVFARRKNLVNRVTRLRFTLENISSREIRMVREATFISPERSDKGGET